MGGVEESTKQTYEKLPISAAASAAEIYIYIYISRSPALARPVLLPDRPQSLTRFPWLVRLGYLTLLSQVAGSGSHLRYR